MKAEQGLQTILLKFDHDVGSRAAEIKLIQKEIQTQQKQFDIWQKTTAKEQLIVFVNWIFFKL